MERVLVTGAAGGIGSRLRKLLKGTYPDIRWSDLKAPADLEPHENFVRADLSVMAEVERAVAGVQGIVHLGGHSIEGPWETILNANIAGCYNLFEAAHRAKVERIVFASSNHAVGFYPRQRKHRHRRAGAARFAIWRKQSVRRSARRLLCLQARPARDLPAHRQRGRRARRQAPAVDLDFSGGPGAVDSHRARASGHPPRDILRHVRQCPRASGTTRRRIASATGRRGAPRITLRRRSPPTPSLPPDPIGEWYQGGPYCSDEFDGGIERSPI